MEISPCNILQGDALTILHGLPSGIVDAVLTDPPYSSGAPSLAAKQVAPAVKYFASPDKDAYPALLGDGKDQRSFTHWSAMWLSECWRVAHDDAALMVFTDWRQLPCVTDALQAAGWHWLGIVVWDKLNNCRPMTGRFRAQCEFIVWGRKGRYRFTGPARPGVYRYTSRTRERYHLTSKPVDLLKDLLAITPQNALVLDPFLGGGSTAVAALETGRRCIGIELSPEYARIATERLKPLCPDLSSPTC